MQIESATPFPQIVEPEAYMEESYALLHEGLQEFLTNRELQLEPKETDYLEAMLDKINFSIKVAEDESDKERLESLKTEVWKSIYEQFCKDYDGVADTAAVFADNLAEMRFVYYFFYYNRRSNLQELLVSKIIADRKSLAQAYRKETKKDFMLSRLKDELPGMKDPAHYSLIAFYQEIVESLLGSDANILEEINHLSLNYDQCNLLAKLFENMDASEAYRAYTAGVMEHSDYNHFLIEIRDSLIERLTEIK
jgi:3-dehydroquinate dehydratase